MDDYNIEFILENYGEEALRKVEEYMLESNVNRLLIYAEPEYDTFEIIGGVLASHSMSIDYVLSLLDINMDSYAEEQHWDGWNYDALEIISVE